MSEGLRPTIERVRQKIGRGSPNTVSPMLERWFSTLGARLIRSPPPETLGALSNETSCKTLADAGGMAFDPGVPKFVASLARKLWEGAQIEARKALAEYEANSKAAEQERTAHFAAQRAALQLAQASFEHARNGLENSLASARQSLRAMQGQLEDAARVRHASEREVARLNHQLVEAHAAVHALERAAVLAQTERDAAMQESQAHLAKRERQLLLDIERERAAAHLALSDLLKEQKERVLAEEQLVRARNEERVALNETRAAVAELRHELASVRASLQAALDGVNARASDRADIASERIHELQRRLSLEEQEHQATRDLLAAAATGQTRPAGSV